MLPMMMPARAPADKPLEAALAGQLPQEARFRVDDEHSVGDQEAHLAAVHELQDDADMTMDSNELLQVHVQGTYPRDVQTDNEGCKVGKVRQTETKTERYSQIDT
jgi:hypothetical protein